jgi:hypothetical protein
VARKMDGFRALNGKRETALWVDYLHGLLVLKLLD